MTDHLKNAKAAIAEAERQSMYPDGTCAPSASGHYHRATAHALVGILEHLLKDEEGAA